MTTVARRIIADGDRGVAQTCDAMAAMIRASIATPIVRRAVSQLVITVAPNDYSGQACAVRRWIAASTQFLRDPAGVELLHSPEWLLRTIFTTGCAQVDCDDVAILAGALMGAIGWSVNLVTVAFLDSRTFSHVYCSATPPSDAFVDRSGEQVWIEFDTTRPMQKIPVNAISRSRIFPVL